MVRDVRGFTIKFYTQEGNFDLVGINFFQFVNEGYRHCKAIAFAKGAEPLLGNTYIKNTKNDQGLILESQNDLTSDFILAMKGHRVWEREKERKVPS